MKYTLLSKAEMDQREYFEKGGMINVYECTTCHRTVMYLYIDSGVTPSHLTCGFCHGEAVSRFGMLSQPSRFWYRPKDLEELKKMVNDAYEANKEEYEKAGKDESEASIKEVILDNYIEHYNQGGLFARSR